jgi:hypothetical protein
MHRTVFLAFYEDAAKVETAAKARGFTGEKGESWHDFVEAGHDRFRTVKQFGDLAKAVKWLQDRIVARATVFGAGSIIEQVPVTRRCSVCTCRGVRELREYTVDDEGIADERDLEPWCPEEPA